MWAGRGPGTVVTPGSAPDTHTVSQTAGQERGGLSRAISDDQLMTTDAVPGQEQGVSEPGAPAGAARKGRAFPRSPSPHGRP